MKYLYLFVFVVYSLIQLMRFAKAFGLVSSAQLRADPTANRPAVAGRPTLV